MAAAAPSSSEVTDKLHPYQDDRVPGPKGAFEARKVKGGFYVRVDMPGVPNGSVKVVKYNDTRKVTFTGKAPTLWPGYDTSGRVYVGYVILDRNPADVEYKSELKNGCLRMFFPGCDGALHFLSSPKTPPTDDPAVYVEQEGEEEFPGDPFVSYIVHDPQAPSGIRLAGGKPDDINPYQLSGVRGVYEHKIVKVEEEGQAELLVYVRLDIPDTCDKSTVVKEDFDRAIVFTARSVRQEVNCRFDEGTREYRGIMTPTCSCCKFSVVKFEIAGGVLRFLLRESDNLD